MLRSLYPNFTEGWAAEGRFWALNNMIALSENCKLDLTKKRNIGVIADELSLSSPELLDFLAVLTSEDVELLQEIEPGIYTTKIIQETLDSVMEDRERSRKRKKSVKNTGSDEKDESSPELSKSSPEPNNKVNKSEVNRSELNKSESGEKKNSLTFFSEARLKKIKALFTTHTKISDPNRTTHIEPVLKFFSQVPEHMTEKDIETCITETFSSLNPGNGVRIDLLCRNIQQKIIAKHEQILNKLKENQVTEAKNERKTAAANKKKEKDLDDKAKLEWSKRCLEFYEQNPGKFGIREKTEIIKAVKDKHWLLLATLIEPKINGNLQKKADEE